jgi:predicted chitinase
MLAKDSPKEGKYVKLVRGTAEVKLRTALQGWDDKKQSYGEKLFYASLEPASPGDTSIDKNSDFSISNPPLTHTLRKIFTPGAEAVWMWRFQYESHAPKHKKGIIEINNASTKSWAEFPLKAGENEVPDAVQAALVIDLKKKKGPPLAKQEALDDEKRRWWQVSYPVFSKRGRAEPKTGWVCEKDFGGVRKCSPWAWPGFELSEADPLEPKDLFIRRITGDYSPNTPLLKLLFDLLDEDGSKQLSPIELRRGWEKPWLAQTLSRQIIEHPSEWGLEKSKWEALDEHMKESDESAVVSAIRFLDVWEEDKKRIEKLQFWKEVKGQHGFPEDIKVWHIHPLGLVENFAKSGCGCKKEFTVELFQQFAPNAQIDKIREYLPEFIRMFERYGITSCLGKAHLLAQLLHESGELQFTKEGGNLTAKDYYPHIGRGLLQITWQKNYKAYGGYATGNEYEFTTENPPWDTSLFRKLEQIPYCVDSAGWFWTMYREGKPVKDLRSHADADDLIFCTRSVNGGFRGYEHRRKCLNKIIEVMEMQEHLKKNRSGHYAFLESRCANNDRDSYFWARYHDPETAGNPNWDCGRKDVQEALIGYNRFLQLGSSNNNWVTKAQQRIAAL